MHLVLPFVWKNVQSHAKVFKKPADVDIVTRRCVMVSFLAVIALVAVYILID